MKRWPIRLNVGLDETLSSWFARMAFAFGCMPSALFRIVFPYYNTKKLDFDIDLNDRDLEILSSLSGVRFDLLRSMMLKGGANVPSVGWERNKKILLTSCSIPFPRKYAVSICPECYCLSRTPYLKRKWRVSYITVCREHGVRLIDECPGCGIRFSLNDKNLFNNYDRSCWNCGLLFRDMKEICDDDYMTNSKYFSDVYGGAARVSRANRRLFCIVHALFGTNNGFRGIDIPECVHNFMVGEMSEDQINILFDNAECSVRFGERSARHRFEALRVAFLIYESKFKIHFPNAHVYDYSVGSVMDYICRYSSW